MSLIVMSLVWWHEYLNENEFDSDNYTHCVHDIIWVLEILIDGGENDKITWLNDEEVVADTTRRGTKRSAAKTAEESVGSLFKPKRYSFSFTISHGLLTTSSVELELVVGDE